MKKHHSTRRGLTGLLAGLGSAFAIGTSAFAASTKPDREAPQSDLSPPVIDRLAIGELMALYAWAYDTEDADLLGRTFTPDGILEVFGNVLVSRREGFSAFIEQAQEMKGEHGWQHLADHHIFRDYSDHRCKVYSYYTMAQSDAKGGNVKMRAMGYYASDCIRTDSGWLFAKRSVVRWNGKLPFTG